MIRVYAALAACVALAVALGGAYLRGRSDGAAHEVAACQAQEIKRIAAEQAQRAQIERQLEAMRAERDAKAEEAANAVAQVRVEYLPGKTVVKREVVERAVFRDCHTGERVRNTINAALAGRPVSGTTDGSGQAGVSGGIGADGG